jgi:hypothetical protein
MELTSALAFSVGPAVSKAVLKMWLKDSTVLQDASADIVDLLKKKTEDAFAQKRAGRQFEEIGEKIAANLLPLFEAEDGIADEGGRIAVANSVADTLRAVPITPDLLAAKDLDPTRLAKHFLDARPSATSGLSSGEASLYQRVIKETSRWIVDVASQLPAFTERTFAEVLKRENLLIDVVNRIYDELQRIRKGSEESNQEAGAARFETDYRLAVARKLDELELFGVDFASSVNRRHRLSVAYVTLSVEKRPQQQHGESHHPVDQPSDLHERKSSPDGGVMPVEVVLQQSKFLIVRGQAGSGKTTLLQWVAVKAATRSFEGSLAEWNALIPFFIRLRDCIESGLPKPEDFPSLIAPAISGLAPNKWVHQKLLSGQAILLVDGVDEMRETQRDDVRKWVGELATAFPRTKIVVSSRPTAIKEGWMDRENFQEAELQPMDLADISVFVDHWHSAVREQLQDEEEIRELASMAESVKSVIKGSPAIRNLATSPLLCAMLCALNRDRRQNLPSDRIELYEACCQMLADRRDKERRVALQDYPQMSYRQKRALLEDLAYWLMTNTWSVVPKERAVERISRRLVNMQPYIKNTTAEDVMRLFIDRTGLLREPKPEHIDFTHRTFQEFFAAKAALDEGNIGDLVNRAHQDQWEEVVVLAAGLAGQKTREELVTGLIQRGDEDASCRHQLHLLAVSCLETSVELSPDITKQVTARLRQLVPPDNATEAAGLASAGELALPYLRYRNGLYATQAAACVRALSLIGTEDALQELTEYADDYRQTVFNALVRAWDHFDRTGFASKIMSKRTEISVNRLRTLEGIQVLTSLESLAIWDSWGISDLSPLSGLQHLKKLTLWRCYLVHDLSPLSAVHSLECLRLWGAIVKDAELAHISRLPHLSELGLSARISDTATEYIARLTELTDLELNFTSITDAGVSRLAPLVKLERLELRGTKVTDACIDHLCQFKALARVDLRKTQVTTSGTEKLRDRIPRIDILFDAGPVPKPDA